MNRAMLFLMSVLLIGVLGQVEASNARWWHWYFPDGTVDKGHIDPKVYWEKYGLPHDMTGKRFYDLGCWDGGTCFEAAARGAKEVFGLDSFVWEIAPQNYQNFCYARDRIAPHVKDDFVEIEPVPSYKKVGEYKELPNKHSIESFAKKHGTADVVLAAGIVYHLVDPIKFLRDLKALVTPDTGLVYITTWCTRDVNAVAHFRPGWRNDTTNFWVFSINCMVGLLNQLGYHVHSTRELGREKEPLVSFVCSVPRE